MLVDCSVHFLKVALLLYHRGHLPVPPDHLGEDAHVGTEEGETLQPYEDECVVPLELQHVGWQQPGGLSKPKGIW